MDAFKFELKLDREFEAKDLSNYAMNKVLLDFELID